MYFAYNTAASKHSSIPHVVICSVYFGLDCFEVSEFTTGVCSAGSGSASNGMDAAPPSQTKRAAGMYTHIHLYMYIVHVRIHMYMNAYESAIIVGWSLRPSVV